MRGGITITEQDVRDIDPIEQKALDLIRHFNDPDHEHVLRGIFKDNDGFAEISAKQRRVETKISRAFSELVVLRSAMDHLKAQGRS